MPRPRAASRRIRRRAARLHRRERRRRLVEQQNAGIERDRLGDLDHLPHADTDARQAAGARSSATPSSTRHRCASRRAPSSRSGQHRDGARPAKMFSPMLTAAGQRQLLEHRRDAELCACFGEAIDTRRAGDHDPPAVRLRSRRRGCSSASTCRRRSRRPAHALRQRRLSNDTSSSAQRRAEALAIPRAESSAACVRCPCVGGRLSAAAMSVDARRIGFFGPRDVDVEDLERAAASPRAISVEHLLVLAERKLGVLRLGARCVRSAAILPTNIP